MSKDSAAIRDQLGNDPDTSFYLNPDYKETVGIEETPFVLKTETLGHAWIVGTSTNAIVGVNTGTEDGQQQVVGGAGRVETIIRVVNNNNVFKEHFRDTDFQDTSQPNTADWDTTNFRLAMSSSSDKSTAYNTIATFKSMFLNLITITKATINATETKYGSDLIKYFLSADGGQNWQEFTIGIESTFSFPGQDLRMKVLFFGNGANETYIEDPQVAYT